MKYEKLEKIVSLCKRRGFVYPGSDIYGGLAGTYDFGPMGVLLRDNIKNAWRRAMTLDHDNVVELDSAIFTDPRVWEASGHVGGFSDPLVEHKPSNQRFRVDKLLDAIEVPADEKMSQAEIQLLFDENFEKLDLPSHKREDYSKVRKFNLLVESNFGITSEVNDDDVTYLRGETAQGIFINFKNVLDSSFVRVPFGIAQIGKAFRNEINPRNFVFRMREFEQMEMQYFVHPDDAEKTFDAFKQERIEYYTNVLGIPAEKLRLKQHENLVFYARDAWDIEYEFESGWDEIEGIHWRGDYDVSQHQEYSGKDLRYTDPYTGDKYVPHVVEVSSGLDRVMYVLLANAYTEDELGGEARTVMQFNNLTAPIKYAVFPLLKNKSQLVEKAREVYNQLRKKYHHVVWDESGNIGKRYRRQDEIGTPYCITVDFDTLEDGTVTVRDRDTGEQERVAIEKI